MDRPDVLRKICKLRVTTPMDVIYLNLAGFEGQDASQFLSTLMVPFHTVISHTPALEELYLAHTVLNTDLATAVLSAHHLHTITLSSCIVEEPLELQICTTVLNANFYHMGEKTLNPGLSFRRSPTYVIYAWPLTREPTSPSLLPEFVLEATSSLTWCAFILTASEIGRSRYWRNGSLKPKLRTAKDCSSRISNSKRRLVSIRRKSVLSWPLWRVRRCNISSWRASRTRNRRSSTALRTPFRISTHSLSCAAKAPGKSRRRTLDGQAQPGNTHPTWPTSLVSHTLGGTSSSISTSRRRPRCIFSRRASEKIGGPSRTSRIRYTVTGTVLPSFLPHTVRR